MAALEIPWGKVQQKADKQLFKLQKKIEKQVTKRFGRYPADGWKRQQFEINVREAAAGWVRNATQIYCETLAGFGNELTRPVIATAWGNGLSQFLRYVIHPQLVLAFGMSKEDSRWISFGPKHWNTPAAKTALAKSDAIRRICDYLDKRTRKYNWWLPSQQEQHVSVSGNENQICAKERRAAVDSYIDEASQETGKRITRTAIWKAAGYKSRTEFERWERCDPKRKNKAADDAIRRVLRDKPHLK